MVMKILFVIFGVLFLFILVFIVLPVFFKCELPNCIQDPIIEYPTEEYLRKSLGIEKE